VAEYLKSEEWGTFLSYFSAMYRRVFIINKNVKNKEEAYGFFIR